MKKREEIEKRERAFGGKPIWKFVWKYLGVSREGFWLKTRTKGFSI